MSRKLDVKKGDIVLSKIISGSNATRGRQPFSEETFDDWVSEMEVISVGKKYITVGRIKNPSHKWTQIKFSIEDDYREHYTCGGADHKLYVSKQEIMNEKEHDNLCAEVRNVFGRYSGCELKLDQLRRIRDIIKE